MARIGFVTDRQRALLTSSDRLAAAALATEGHEVVPLIWSGELQQAAGLDLAVYRSAWDTWASPEIAGRFLAFVRALPEVVPRVQNPVALMEWGLDKRYMLDLARAGIPVPRTFLATTAADVAHAFDELDAARAVVKPAMGGSGDGVELIDRFFVPPASVAGGAWLVQEFMPSISGGEVSVIVIDSVVAHAVRKIPSAGEWRTNSHFNPRYELEMSLSEPIRHRAPGDRGVPRPAALRARGRR